MHMADALLSPAVAVTMYAASAAAAGVSLVQLRREELAAPETAKKKLPTMAVMSALVFAGQMINYTIPGTRLVRASVRRYAAVRHAGAVGRLFVHDRHSCHSGAVLC